MHTHALPFTFTLTFTLTFTGRAEGFFGEAAFDAAAFASRFGLGALPAVASLKATRMAHEWPHEGHTNGHTNGLANCLAWLN